MVHMPETKHIVLDGVRVHNLKSIHVEIPLGRLTVVTGVSGAGKSSLAFDTLYAEAQRRYLQSFSASSRQLLERFERPDADTIGDLPPAVAFRRRPPGRGPRATVGSLTEVSDYLRLLFSRAGTVHCWQCGTPVRVADMGDVLTGAASLPHGTRFAVAFPARPESAADRDAWAAGLLEEGLVRVQIRSTIYHLGEQSLPAIGEEDRVWVLLDRLEAGTFAPERLTESAEIAFSRGNGRLALLHDGQEMIFDRRLICSRCNLELPELEPALFDCNDPRGACPVCAGTGILSETQNVCAECQGRRWNRAALAVRLAGRNISELSSMSFDELAAFLSSASLGEANRHAAGVDTLLAQLRHRLEHLTAIDLGHLTLMRAADTLSGGMAVRILAASLASNLVQALYLLEEPAAGLHPRDTGKLLAELRRLRDTGNTVVVIEHNGELIAAADHVIDIGPAAGEEGGHITYQGPPAGLAGDIDTPTAEFFSGRRAIGVPARRRPARGSIRLSGARLHTLQDVTVDFPLGVLCVVTGVGGAGKSSLVAGSLYPALCFAKKKKGPPPPARVTGAGQVDEVILMDQQPLPRSSRSNAATYLKVFDEIREVFAATAEAKIRNFGPGHFSFNQPGGRCETCEGQGTLTIDMQFLADVAVACPECHGSRYRREILDVKVRGLSIAGVLDLTAREAFRFFRAQPAVERRLKHLLDVGLDYLKLGQSADTLSGGESQRLKLAGHLASSRKPRCLFLLMEPSAGLHSADVQGLLDCFDRLLGAGHSIVLVENNLDMVKAADHVIDLGPEGGSRGGRVVAAGSPEEVARAAPSHTGRLLRDQCQIVPR
jgi:excinuclease ABC subunit A